MIKIKINLAQENLLLTNVETAKLAARLLQRDVNDVNGSMIVGAPDEIDALRDSCSGVLLRVGFNEKYVATPDGNLLEDLIDKFYL